VDAGAKPHLVSEALYETYPQRRLTLLKEVLGSLNFQNNGTVAKLFLTQADLIKAQAKDLDSEEFVNLPRGVVGVKIVCFIKEKNPREWKLSIRSRGNVDVLKIAQVFGGGGHKLAAGATLQGTRTEIEEQLDIELRKQGYL
jgi:phosphoesterase RecJ-like protein